MPEQRDKVYQFDPLSDYTFRQRTVIHLADLAFYGFTKTLGATTRFEVVGREHWDAIEAAGRSPIFAFWHDSILLSTYFFNRRGIVVLVSKSFDGEYISRVLKRMGIGTIRGSSSRGGARALIEMVRKMRAGHPMAFTIDGPRGPRHKVKPGPVMLAKKTGNPILPFVIAPRKHWELNSWDKMHIPCPFTTAAVIFGKPIYVDKGADAAEIDAKNAALQTIMEELGAEGKKWSAGEG